MMENNDDNNTAALLSFTLHCSEHVNTTNGGNSPNTMVWWARVLAEAWRRYPTSYPLTCRLYLIRASLLFNTFSFVIYQIQTSTYCPHICCGRRSLATVMLWLLSNPQLYKHKGHLQVGRHRDVCLSRQSTSLSFLQLTPSPPNVKVKRRQELTTAQFALIGREPCTTRVRNINGVWSVEGRKFKNREGRCRSGEKKCQTLEDIISKGASQIGLSRWLWRITVVANHIRRQRLIQNLNIDTHVNEPITRL